MGIESDTILLRHRQDLAVRFEKIEKLEMQTGSSGQTIIHPDSLPPVIDKTGITQISQVAGDRRLREMEDRHQVADTQFVVAE